MLEEKLVVLKKELIIYASLVESMVEKSVKGLLVRDPSILNDVIKIDEQGVNTKEIELDEFCTTLIAQYQPKAKNLRSILMALRMISDLERMGDHAVNIAEASEFLITKPSIKPLIDIPRMAEVTKGMLKDSISAYINEDASLAKNVCERDNIVDGLKDQVLRELITYMNADTSVIERALQLINITRNLERIADLSTNIGEEVMFLVEGREIRHHAEDKANLNDK